MNGSTNKEFVAWVINRFAGVLLIFLLAIHFGYMHFYATWPLRFDDMLESPFLRVVDLSLLVVVVYHTFYGFRAWLLDFNISDRARGAITVLVSLAGLAIFVLGVRIYLEFLV